MAVGYKQSHTAATDKPEQDTLTDLNQYQTDMNSNYNRNKQT